MIAQKTQSSIEFRPTWKEKTVELEKNYWAASLNDSINIETLKFYISDIRFFQNDSCVDALAKKYWLIDLEEPVSLKYLFDRKINTTFNRIEFKLGIDSLTSVSGAFGGDLDPTNGMYWTWQSGYINFKMEGYSNRCPARNHFFQLHIGGYQHPYNTQQAVVLPITNNKEIIIKLALDKLLTEINPAENYEVMSPNSKAMEIAGVLQTVFGTKK